MILLTHKTSATLEDAFWKALKEIAIVRDTTLSNTYLLFSEVTFRIR